MEGKGFTPAETIICGLMGRHSSTRGFLSRCGSDDGSESDWGPEKLPPSAHKPAQGSANALDSSVVPSPEVR